MFDRNRTGNRTRSSLLHSVFGFSTVDDVVESKHTNNDIIPTSENTPLSSAVGSPTTVPTVPQNFEQYIPRTQHDDDSSGDVEGHRLSCESNHERHSATTTGDLVSSSDPSESLQRRSIGRRCFSEPPNGLIDAAARANARKARNRLRRCSYQKIFMEENKWPPISARDKTMIDSKLFTPTEFLHDKLKTQLTEEAAILASKSKSQSLSASVDASYKDGNDVSDVEVTEQDIQAQLQDALLQYCAATDEEVDLDHDFEC